MSKKTLFLFFIYNFNIAWPQKKPKIIGLIAVRNEEHIIEQCLHALSLYTDAIILLDDVSTDNTLPIIESVTCRYNIEKIIKKKKWIRDEPGDKNLLLQAGRNHHGTHFIILDADELFTSNCLKNNFLRRTILSMQPGDQLMLNWIHLWRSTAHYRSDDSPWSNHYKCFVFCDDGVCSYQSEFIHTDRTPNNLTGIVHKINGYTCGVLHFQFVNWQNLQTKQLWYRYLERIYLPQKPVSEINKRYAINETNIKTILAPNSWFSYYPFFNHSIYSIPNTWYQDQISKWKKQYGNDYFHSINTILL